MKRVLIVLSVVLAVTACTAEPKPVPPAPTTTPAVIDTCAATSDLGPFERQGLGNGVEMWVLLMSRSSTLNARDELKMVVRLTGDRDVTVSAVGPSGRVALPVWGPEWHSGSNFQHPGNEFGVGFIFPTEGCWRVEVANRSGIGRLTLRVGPPAGN